MTCMSWRLNEFYRWAPKASLTFHLHVVYFVVWCFGVCWPHWPRSIIAPPKGWPLEMHLEQLYFTEDRRAMQHQWYQRGTFIFTIHYRGKRKCLFQTLKMGVLLFTGTHFSTLLSISATVFAWLLAFSLQLWTYCVWLCAYWQSAQLFHEWPY